MNHTYRLVWNEAAQRDVPAAEAARCRGKSGGCRAKKPLRAIILAAAFGGTYVCSVDAAPTGGTVVAGQGTISQTGGTTTVRQQSQNLSLNWLGFSISPAETVQFVQPSTTAIALNRVTGTDASQIYGHLVANGQVFLINPNGVLFAPTAQVDVGSLVASSLNISNADFLSGNYKFQTGSSNSAGSASPASVINQGSITAAAGGSVALLGGQVSNQGTITARLGTVALAAGSAMTLDFRGNKLMSVQVDRSAVGALAENRQLIQADGGTVIMTAAARDALLNTVVNNTGVIEARTIQNHGGEIKLLGSPDGGTVNVDGTLDASAPSGGNGGSIETSGTHVEIAGTARITTAAPTGETGTWLVDPTDFTIAPSGGDISGTTLSNELGNTSVTLASTSGSASGNGDIFVNDAVSWGANTTLTLTATRNIQVNGTITASGSTAGLTLNYGSGGNYYVNTGGKVTLSGTNPSLSIGGQAYTVINSLGVQGDTTGTTLQGIQNSLSGFYALGTDINASTTSGWNSGKGFAPLGNSSAAFTGVFEGLNHTVTGLTINRPNNSYVGMFGNNSGTIRDVGLAGGSVTGLVNVGALAGYNTGVIYNSYATANVSSTSAQVGGLVGWNDSGSISNSYATGNVSGTNYIGGLVGWNHTGSISDSYASGNVTSTGTSAGGLVGYMSTSSTDPSITNSYATGTVQGNGDAGGLVGTLINGSITNSYSTGAVTGTTNAGGFVGSNANGTSITNSFWNITTSGQNASAGGGTGMTTAQMEAQADFTSATAANGNVNPNWDFTSVWRIYDGYTAPLLKALLTPLTITADNISATYNGSTSSAALTNPIYSVAGADTSGHLQGTATPYANDRNVGTYAPVLWSDQQGYDITVRNSTLTITPATLTISATSNTKTYDGTVTATATPTFSGLQTGDTITGLTEAYADKNAGTGKTLSVTGYTVSDSNGGNNYTVSTVPDASGVIDKTTLTLTAATNTKTYDGTATAAATPTFSGLQTGDSITGLTEIYGDKNAGTGKPLYVSSFTSITDSNGGNSSNNYTLNIVDNATGVINKANLTITAASNTKTYDGTVMAAATPTFSGLQTGDTIIGLTEAYVDKNAGTGKTLSVAGYTVGDSNGGNNYTVSTVNDTSGVIDKATLTLTAISNTKTYDGTVTAATTPTFSGLQTGDSVTGLSETYADKNAGTGKTLAVTSYTVSDSNGGNNYTVSTVNDTSGVIDKATLTLTATTNTKTYDGTATAAATPTFSGLQTGDSITGLSETYADKNAGTGKTLAVSGYTVNDSNGGNNYTVSTVNDTSGVIDKATLTLTAATNTKTYDGTATAAATPTFSGLQTGDTITGLTEAYADKNAGTGKTLSVAGYTVGDSNGGNNYTVSTVNDTSGVIDKATLTLTATTNTKTYDGTATAAATATFSGLQTGDSVIGLTEAYTDKNAGSGKTLAVTGYTVNDSNGGNNYAVSTVTDTTGVIGKATLTLTAATNTKTYDGAVTAAATPTFSGLQTGDTITGLTEAYADKNAGTGKTLSVAGYTVGDSNGGNNYTVSTVNDTSGVIDKAMLTLTATTNTKTYDGTATAAATATFSGLQTGDSVIGLTEAYTDKNAGSRKTLAVTGYTVNDSNGGNNYTVSTVTDTSGVINKANLTLAAASNTKTYDGTTAAGGVVATIGNVASDTVSASEAYVSKNVMGTNGSTLQVAHYSITDAGGADMSGNYNVITTAAAGTIDPATITVSGTTAANKTYDGSVDATISGGVLNGAFSGDSVGLLQTGSFSDRNAGTNKTVTENFGLSGSDSGNYTLAHGTGQTTANITPKTLTVIANAQTKTYGQADPTLSYASSGYVSGTFNGVMVNDTVASVLTGTLTRVAGEAVHGGPYAISRGSLASNGNYSISYTGNFLTITPATITLSGITANDKPYNATTTAELNTGAASLVGRIGGDSLGVAATGIFVNPSAGTGKTVTISNLTLTGAASGNYVLAASGNESSTTASITPDNLTITADNATKAASTTNPALTLTYSGFVAGESASSLTTRPTVSTTAGTTSPAGNYPITASGAVDPNYTFTYVPGTLTVLGNASTSSPNYTGALANLSNVDANGTSGSGSGVGEGEAHGAALDCSGYVHCVEIPGYLADNDGEDMRGSSRGALSLWSLIILDGGIRLPVDVR